MEHKVAVPSIIYKRNVVRDLSWEAIQSLLGGRLCLAVCPRPGTGCTSLGTYRAGTATNLEAGQCSGRGNTSSPTCCFSAPFCPSSCAYLLLGTELGELKTQCPGRELWRKWKAEGAPSHLRLLIGKGTRTFFSQLGFGNLYASMCSSTYPSSNCILLIIQKPTYVPLSLETVLTRWQHGFKQSTFTVNT